MISSALTHGERQKAFAQQKITDVVDMLYKKSLIRDATSRSEIGRTNAETSRINALRQLNSDAQNAPFGISMSLNEFKSLDTDTKSYLVYAMDAKKRDEVVMPYNEFINQVDDPILKQYFDLTKDPDFGKEFKEFIDRNVKAGTAKTPAPVTWTTATGNLTKRFGRLDPTGMWAVTPELQATHRKAQEFLVDFKGGGMEPLKAINEAENKARDWMSDREDRYFQYIEAAERAKREDKVDEIKSSFLKAYGYIPSQRR